MIFRSLPNRIDLLLFDAPAHGEADLQCDLREALLGVGEILLIDLRHHSDAPQ